MPGWILLDGQLKKIKNIWIGVDGETRKVTNSWIGANDTPRHWYSHKIIPPEQAIHIHIHPIYQSLLDMYTGSPAISIIDSNQEVKLLDNDIYTTTSELQSFSLLGDANGLLRSASFYFGGNFYKEWDQSVMPIYTEGSMPTAAAPVFEFPFPPDDSELFEFSIVTPISIQFVGLNGKTYLIDDYVSEAGTEFLIDDAISEIRIAPKIYLQSFN